MGFNKLDSHSFEGLDGFSDFMQQPTLAFFKHRASEAEALLNQFKHQIFF